MEMYVDEEDIWKCPKHPSKRRRSGICPTCLRERLITLCPDCAKVRPCSCHPTTFSRFSFAGDGGGSVGRVYNIIDSEPSLRKSRSVAIPFLRSRSRFSAVGYSDSDGGGREKDYEARSFWSMFKSQKSRREKDYQAKVLTEVNHADLNTEAVMARSKSVAVSGDGEVIGRTKGRWWFFPSPMKAFRNSKVSKF
ncbi:PREDICTED: uncharacterized protein LOC109332333 isoform X2 [Lupinus angustifolius]|uniref:uncharacterized protein LOC109332333 isoform X2 n=1 Tax=Lupinus angustifolius TaxID=3871 RepID=UPI00092E27CF|nr:PREDICTED: uncharacterized protein LOC109332333 isoform X2 [Lupinus angustifolius]